MSICHVNVDDIVFVQMMEVLLREYTLELYCE